MDKKQKIETNLKKMFQEIIQENHDHPIQKPIQAKCNDCKHRIPKTAKAVCCIRTESRRRSRTTRRSAESS